MDNRSECARRAKRQKVILQGVAVTLTAVAVWPKEKYVDKSPVEDYDFLRRQILKHLFDGRENNCY